MSLDYSLSGEINRVIFYKRFNDVNFFVEDKDKEYEYEIIFKRLFEKEFKVSKVFGIGGKPELTKAYLSLKESKDLNIFVADLDFDVVLGKQYIHDKIFIYLDRYCIENYLIDHQAVIYFMQGRIGAIENEVKKIIDFDNWFNQITEQFYRLHLLFLVVQDNELGVPNVGESTFKYLVNNSWNLDNEKYDKYYELIKSYLPDIDSCINQMEKLIESKVGASKHKIICGKFYYDSLKRYLIGFCDYKSIYDRDLRNFLLRHFDVSQLIFIKDIVEQIKNASSKAS